MNKTALNIIVALVIGAVAGVAGVNWFSKQQASPAAGPAQPKPAEGPPAGPPVATVHTAAVQSLLLPRNVTAVGSLRSQDSVMLRPEITGRIAAIGFEEGAHADQGQVLVQLDDSVARAQLGQAQANLQLANSQSRRARQLSSEGFVSKQALDDAVSQQRVQEAALALAKAQLEKTVISAPFAGILGLRYVSVGDYVSPGTDLVQIESIDPLQVDFRVPEQYLAVLKPGQTLSVSFDALPGVQRQGSVDAIHPVVDVGGRSILLRANIPNPDELLRPGLFARVGLQLDNTEALVVPEAALAPAGETQYIYRVKDGRVERLEVQTGLRTGGQVEITHGLEAGDEVVIAGIQKISDGASVRVIPASPAAGNPG